MMAGRQSYWIKGAHFVGLDRPSTRGAKPKAKVDAKLHRAARPAPRERSGLTVQTLSHLLPAAIELDARAEAARIAASIARDTQLVDVNPKVTAQKIVAAAAKARMPTGGGSGPAPGTLARAIIDAGKKRRGEI